MSPLIIDLETLSAPREQILANLPPWSEEEARSRMPKNYSKKETQNSWLEDDKANHGKDVIEKAALNPETATIAIVGFWRNGKVEQLAFSEFPHNELPWVQHLFLNEAELIEHAFMRMNESHEQIVLAWNLGWDMKMLIRRAWILGVPVPKSIFQPLARYPISERFVCLMERYGVSRGEKFMSLDSTLKALKLPPKSGSGEDFGKLWETGRQKALEYNANDLLRTSEVAKRMGVLP